MSSFITLRQRRPLHIHHTEKVLQDQKMEWPSPRRTDCSVVGFILLCSCPPTKTYPMPSPSPNWTCKFCGCCWWRCPPSHYKGSEKARRSGIWLIFVDVEILSGCLDLFYFLVLWGGSFSQQDPAPSLRRKKEGQLTIWKDTLILTCNLVFSEHSMHEFEFEASGPKDMIHVLRTTSDPLLSGSVPNLLSEVMHRLWVWTGIFGPSSGYVVRSIGQHPHPQKQPQYKKQFGTSTPGPKVPSLWLVLHKIKKQIISRVGKADKKKGLFNQQLLNLDLHNYI